MATARIAEGLWTCTKRWALEIAIEKAGHKWPHARSRQPMSGAECLGRALAWMDARGDYRGDLSDATPDDIEFAAGWVGAPGVLYAALVETGWIDRKGEAILWHDYAAYNSLALARKEAGRRGGLASAEARLKQTGSNRPKQTEANVQAKTKATPEANVKQPEAKSPSKREANGQQSGMVRYGMGLDGKGTEKRGESEPPPSNPIVPPELGSAADLAGRIGDSIDKCSQAIRELEAQGVPPERVRSRVEAANHGQPIGAWAWKASVLAGWKADQPKPNADHGPRTESTNGARFARLAAEKAKAQADLEAFKASGCATRSEWIAMKAERSANVNGAKS